MVTRACGSRVENGLYLTVPSSPFGRPLEAFLIDPAIPWGGGSLRAPMLVPDPSGTYHVLLGIGADNYPYFSDFFEEAARFGVSKRIPLDFNPARLTPGKSKFLLMHPRGIPKFDYTTVDPAPCNFKGKVGEGHECVGNLWPLSALGDRKDKHVVVIHDGNDKAKVQTPSCSYRVNLPIKPQAEFGKGKRGDARKYEPGILLGFAFFTFEYVNKKGECPKEVSDRFKSKFSLGVVPE